MLAYKYAIILRRKYIYLQKALTFVLESNYARNCCQAEAGSFHLPAFAFFRPLSENVCAKIVCSEN